MTGFLVKWMFKALKPHSAHFYSLTRRVKPWEKQLDVPRIWVSIEYASVLGRRRQWHPTPVLLPGKSHGRRSLEGCSPWGCEELDTTERLHFHFHALEKEMATHSSVFAWRISGMGEPGGLPFMGLHRVGHN